MDAPAAPAPAAPAAAPVAPAPAAPEIVRLPGGANVNTALLLSLAAVAGVIILVFIVSRKRIESADNPPETLV